MASDTGDVRQAIVIYLAASATSSRPRPSSRLPGQQRSAGSGAASGAIVDGHRLHHFSGDLAGYPEFLPGRGRRFDPVGEVFYVVADDSGWNRESWDVKSVPTEEAVQRRFSATDFLERGR